ncbi:proline iminopeptidase-family hydrolase [uncultured Sphingomonas sp.]|mgnify:CR=1 FL=1|uniref:proline iminopeptidase-family hydrolase n=1 Tax=uncultured Sphingomonas sp. TaxID=158754 RepID=UPI002638CA9E|nr:proline iminopeptidase-family hydrolase [uncultured Sphingomonas sp.]
MGLIDRRLLLAGGLATLLPLPAMARGLASYPAPTREEMVLVEGGRVYARVNGDLAGPRAPLLLIHGGPGGTHDALLEALPLADERAVILYDQLDSGRSDQPNDPANWRVSRFVDEVDAIRRALGLTRCHVLGHSWGGTIALEYGARRPAGLAGLALASPLIATRSWIGDANILVDALPAPIRDEIRRCEALKAPQPASCATASKAFYAAYNGREPASDARRAYASAVGGHGFNARLYETMWGSSEFVSTGTLRKYDGEPLLARLDGKRTLFICGQYDEARPATIGSYAARVPGAEFAVIPGAAHNIFGDRPEETIAVLRGWLARQDALA